MRRASEFVTVFAEKVASSTVILVRGGYDAVLWWLRKRFASFCKKEKGGKKASD